MEQVDQAVPNGAKVVLCDQRRDRPHAFMEPTILTNIKPGNHAYRDELLGPVAQMLRVENENEAAARANDSDFKLVGSFFTGKVTRGERPASRCDTGMVFINHPWTAPEQRAHVLEPIRNGEYLFKRPDPAYDVTRSLQEDE